MSKQIGVTRYIVSYSTYIPDGGHLPEKPMDWTGYQTVEGITLSSDFDTYWRKEEQAAEHITEIEVSRIAFKPNTPDTYFEVPQVAKMITDKSSSMLSR